MSNPLDSMSLVDMGLWAEYVMAEREPDLIIGDNYLRRWWLVPRNDYCNVYLHEILQSDSHTPHDHPWDNSTIVLSGSMREHHYERAQYRRWVDYYPGARVLRDAGDSHRLEIPSGGRCVTLFITGAKLRDWGFWCPGGRWIPWQQFMQGAEYGQLGRGCD